MLMSLLLCLTLNACHQHVKQFTTRVDKTKSVQNNEESHLLSTQISANSEASTSQLLHESGQAIVGQKIPFFSGWALNAQAGQAYSLRMIEKDHKSRYVLTVCASWCKPCMSGLKRLSEAKERFIATNTGLIIIVADQSHFGQELYENLGFDWAYVMIDEFKVSAFKLAPSSKKNESLTLPRTFVFNSEGIIEKIIGIEGHDYIDLLLNDQ